MNTQLIEKYRQSSDAALQWLMGQFQDDGSYGPAINDLASYYKSPYLFLISGRSEEAKRIVKFIQHAFMQVNGDFLTATDKKSENAALTEFWAYTNGWITLAAQKMGCFEIAYPAYRYLLSFQHEKSGGFTTQRPCGGSKNIVDVLTTAHLGLAALYFGEIEKAVSAGKLLQKFLNIQPDLSKGLYLRMNDKAELITGYAQDAAIFYQVSTIEPFQAYFMIGYPIAFLGKLYRATGNSEFLDTAISYLDFAMSCHESIRSFHFSHKVAWGAAIVAGLKRENKYADFSRSIVDYLLTIQDTSGAWLIDEPATTSFDQTAEIAIWLREIGSEIMR
ncbi:MAG: hypothetical protein GY801_37890 [bacterium]|nr:hypothetical protein [bacterium]